MVNGAKISVGKYLKDLNNDTSKALLDSDPESAQWDKFETSSGLFDGAEGTLTDFETFMAQAWKSDQMSIIARKEKTFSLEEEINLATTTKANFSVNGQTISGLRTRAEVSRRPIYIFPLASVEKDANRGHFTFFEVDSNARLSTHSQGGGVLDRMRNELIDSPEYKFLFEYVFPLPRMLSLITIYSGNSLSLSKPDIDDGFNKTKETLRTLFYTLSESEEEWWAREDERMRELGGAAGLHQKQSKNASTKGPSVDLVKMAMATVPILVRGMAEWMDPHYALVSKAHDAGAWPLPKNWTSVFPLWPVTFPFGWGPPLTPLGMAAYSMPQLSGDKNKQKEAESKMKTEKAIEENESPCEDDEQ